MTVLPLQIDCELWVRGLLSDAFAGVARVATETPANLADVLPVITVLRIGGRDDGVVVDSPVFDIQCFAATRAAAYQYGYQVGAVLRGARGTIRGDVTLVDVETVSGPSSVPYDNPNVRRVVATYQLRIKPA
jgi:hypothetical protein